MSAGSKNKRKVKDIIEDIKIFCKNKEYEQVEELLNECFKAIDPKVKVKISVEEENSIPISIKNIKKELTAYRRMGEDDWKKYQKEEKNSRQAQEAYNRFLTEQEEYKRDVKCYVEPFEKIMACLVCFAGSTSEEEYLRIAVCLENEQENLRVYTRQYREVLERLKKEMPEANQPCPLFLFGEKCENKSESEENFKPGIEEPEFINEINALINQCDDKNKYNEASIKGLNKRYNKFKENWDEYKSNMENRIKDTRQAAEKYRNQIEQDKLYYKERRIHWECRALLKSVLRLIDEIETISETVSEKEKKDWYIKMGQKARGCLNKVKPTNGDIEFFLIDYGDEISLSSEEIRAEFISGDVCWPGLYFHIGEEEKCFCIIPGRNGNKEVSD